MESRLPKPTKSMPVNRTKTGLNLNNITRLPFSQDLLNRPKPTSLKRALSPDLKSCTVGYRPKLRRSRSVSDFRDFSCKREQTLAKIPAQPINQKLLTSTATVKKAPIAKGKLITLGTNTSSSINNKPTVAPTKTMVKRIPSYDYKARYNDLLEKHKILKEKFDKKVEQLSAIDNLPELFEDSQNELFKKTDELKNIKTEMECLQRLYNMQKTKNDALTTSLQVAQENLSKFTKECGFLTKENAEFKTELIELKEKNKTLSSKNEMLIKQLEESQDQLFRANLERKDLHNAIMDLRGNIRVFCRVRPALAFEDEKLLCGWSYLDESSLEICNNQEYSKNKTAKHEFSFDHVFHPRSTQEDIFEMVSPLIQSALDGYNVCIFAYGQTGSGKTFTMEGLSHTLGIIPRTVDLLFESVKNYKRLGWTYEIRASFLEIYNEVLNDLLDYDNKDLEIRMVSATNKTDVYVSNITEEIVKNSQHLKELIHTAKMNRATAATVANERSSRSHAVTRIQLIGTHETKMETSVGIINLVDLAGSESPKTSIRMDETKKINRSLSELTNVILALLQRQEHIPYRNSKLTHLLMPCLGGNSKTLMFINVAPFQDCFVESVKSLRFAASVNSCKVVKAKKNKYV